MNTLAPELIRLKNYLQEIQQQAKFYIAFSGGLDSRFLAYSAKKFGFFPILLHAKGVHIPQQETKQAVNWAKKQNLELELIAIDPLGIPEVESGSKERCYYCKYKLFSEFLNMAKPLSLCDGTNFSDLDSYRPGLRALTELKIHSPLAACQITKDKIRELGKTLGLDDYLQKARPCLLTRLDYGLMANANLLLTLSAAEARIEDFLQQQLEIIPDFRLRLVARNKLELHIEHNLTGDIKKQIKSLINAEDLPCVDIVYTKAVSGHFDKDKA